MELEAKKQLRQFFYSFAQNEQLMSKEDNKVKSLLFEAIANQEKKLTNAIREAQSLPINIANEKIKEYKEQLKLVRTMQLYFNEVIGELLLKFREPQKQKELAERQRQEVEKYVEQSTKQFRNMIKPESSAPTVEERLTTILEEASKKHPIPSKEDISKGNEIGE